MKILVALALLSLAFAPIRRIATDDITCVLSSDKQVYKKGELPVFTVSIRNNSKKDIYLIGALDGSDMQWRYPHCYYTIEGPANEKPKLSRCGVMNPVRLEDFILVKAGELFSPYETSSGFFPDHNITQKETFARPGSYKISFHYSTQSGELAEYRGTPVHKSKEDSAIINNLFSQTPRLSLQSNMVSIIVKE